MNDYLKSINNLEKEITDSIIEPQAIIEEIPILSESSNPPMNTETENKGIQNQNNESFADYLSPRTIIVRKYRLKK